jgi:orotidine-5'-phosphate decarboxylase
MDAKRGDIGSTAAAYADAFLGRKPLSPWGCDCLTINPYLGDDSLTPFTQLATERGAGLFVLVKTSNSGSKTFQEQTIDDQPLYRVVADHVQGLAAADVGTCGYGSVGAVIGATHPQQLTELRSAMPNSLFLVPGLGAQGGTAADVAGAFDDNGLGAVVNSSRAIIFAYQREPYASASSWQAAVEQATIDTNQQIAEHTAVANL